jgi:hypothetical protein
MPKTNRWHKFCITTIKSKDYEEQSSDILQQKQGTQNP